jgi:hypothetical protein
MKLGVKNKATILKGVYNLNPTKMIMKQGSKEAREAHARSASARRKVERPIKGKTK